MLITDAARAEVKTLFLAIDNNYRRMDVRLPTPVSMTLRVADGITESGGFPTNIALQNRYSLTI
jgi:hypothetical protein